MRETGLLSQTNAGVLLQDTLMMALPMMGMSLPVEQALWDVILDGIEDSFLF